MVPRKPMSRTNIFFYNQAPYIHSLYRTLFKYPPQGYSFTVEQKIEGVQALNRNSIVWWINIHIIKRLVNTVAIKDFLFRFRRIDTPLIYSGGYVVYKRQPWVVDFEYASSFTGYDNQRLLKKRAQIERALSAEDCKAIISWNQWGMNTLLSVIDTPKIRGKAHVVPVAIEPPTVRHVKHEKSTLLFVGSANLPKDFYHKGGKAALRVYKELKRKHTIKLIMRCRIPPELDEWMQEYRNDPDVEIYEDVLSQEDLDRLFARSDILISPTVTTPILIYLDAMGREIPVVTTNAWANAEIVEHRKTGIIVEKPALQYYEIAKLPVSIWDWEETVKTFDEDKKFIRRFAAGVAEILKHPERIRSYGKAGRQLITKGKFSLSARERKLKRIFDDALMQ